jgi:hypothetical protein
VRMALSNFKFENLRFEILKKSVKSWFKFDSEIVGLSL